MTIMRPIAKARGLHTFRNLYTLQSGALTQAKNVVIDRDDTIEPRRGMKQFGTSETPSSVRISQIFDYRGFLLRQTSANKFQYDSDGEGTFVDFSGTFSPAEDGVRTKSSEMNGNLYFTSDAGIMKLAAASASDLTSAIIRNAGGVRAGNLSASVNYSTPGFLLGGYSVSYRLVWGYRDVNDNLILGVPSEVATVTNFSSSSAVVHLSFTIPPEIFSTDFFYQIVRTNINLTDPGLEFNLVFEDFIPNLPPGTITVTDITPEEIRDQGTPLYTNPTSGSGIASANYKPPFAKDIALFKGYTFLANTSTVQRLDLNLLSVSALTNQISTISITDGSATRTYTFQGRRETYTATFTGTTGANYTAGGTNPGRYFTIDAATIKNQPAERSYYVWYKETAEVDPALSGKLGIMVEIDVGDTAAQVAQKTMTQILIDTDDFNVSISTSVLTIDASNNGWVQATPTDNITGAFTIIANGAGYGEDAASNKVFLPKVPTLGNNGPTAAQQIDQAARSLVDVVSNDSSGLVYAYYLSDASTIPGKMNFEQRLQTGNAFWLYANSTNTGGEFTPPLGNSSSNHDVISSNEIRPNRLYYSKYQEPEAFPLGNYIDVGPKDKAIQRIIPLRDGLFIFKEDAIYRLSGEIAPFQVAEFDKSAILRAVDSAVVLNNQIYALTTQDIVTVTDSGVNAISRQIENLIKAIRRPGFDYITASFGVSYESDRAYLFYTVTEEEDTVATQCFRYNTFTQTWTLFDVTATCGLVKFEDDKLYVGAGDEPFMEQERKNLDITDYADREYTLAINADGVDETEVTLSSITLATDGDVIEQTQYLTIAQYNRILKKLDIDPAVGNQDYYADLIFAIGENARDKIVALATKLDADPGIADTNYVAKTASISGTITNVTTGSDTTFTVTAGQVANLVAGRWVTISGIATTPVINGSYQVKSVNSGANQFTIENATTAVSDTTGTFATPITDFRDIQGAFNVIVSKLNADTGAFYSNYPASSGTIAFKGLILNVDKTTNVVTVHQIQPFMEGPVTLYKAYEQVVEYTPDFGEDPTTQKQFPETSLVFENNNFNGVDIAFATDLSPGFQSIEFTAKGTGEFGDSNFGEIDFGGVAAPIPLRCLVPRQKQRGIFLRVRFTHIAAIEKFSLLECKNLMRPYNTRNYRSRT